jgi:cytochrome c oxidase cbb3-type subunit 4
VDIGTLQAYAYFGVTILLVVMLYGYIYYVHTDKKRGEDYERFADLALHDGLDDDPVQEYEERKLPQGSKEKDK